MSIYGSLAAPDEDHVEECGGWKETAPQTFEWVGPCDCGLPDTPLVYQGSHIFPGDSDERGGWVDLAMIDGHITRDGRDDAPEGGKPWPYLRFGVNQETVVLTRRNVEQVAASLNEWLELIA